MWKRASCWQGLIYSLFSWIWIRSHADKRHEDMERPKRQQVLGVRNLYSVEMEMLRISKSSQTELLTQYPIKASSASVLLTNDLFSFSHFTLWKTKKTFSYWVEKLLAQYPITAAAVLQQQRTNQASDLTADFFCKLCFLWSELTFSVFNISFFITIIMA